MSEAIITTILRITNYDEVLKIKKEEGLFYCAITHNGNRLCWNQIPESLYYELLEFELDRQRRMEG